MANTKEHQTQQRWLCATNSTRTPTQQRPTAPGGLQVPAAELFDPTPPERRASDLAFRGAVFREGSRSRLALPHRTLVPGPGTGPTALGNWTFLSDPWRARSFPGRYQRCIEPGVECADPASTNGVSPFDSNARRSVSQTSHGLYRKPMPTSSQPVQHCQNRNRARTTARYQPETHQDL